MIFQKNLTKAQLGFGKKVIHRFGNQESLHGRHISPELHSDFERSNMLEFHQWLLIYDIFVPLMIQFYLQDDSVWGSAATHQGWKGFGLHLHFETLAFHQGLSFRTFLYLSQYNFLCMMIQ